MGENPSVPRSRGLEKPMLSPEVISISKEEVVKMTTLIEPVPKEMLLIGGEDTIYWLCK